METQVRRGGSHGVGRASLQKLRLGSSNGNTSATRLQVRGMAESHGCVPVSDEGCLAACSADAHPLIAFHDTTLRCDFVSVYLVAKASGIGFWWNDLRMPPHVLLNETSRVSRPFHAHETTLCCVENRLCYAMFARVSRQVRRDSLMGTSFVAVSSKTRTAPLQEYHLLLRCGWSGFIPRRVWCSIFATASPPPPASCDSSAGATAPRRRTLPVLLSNFNV